MAAKDYVYGVKGPARVANQYKWTTLKMKIKKIIKEELQKLLKEQSYYDEPKGYGAPQSRDTMSMAKPKPGSPEWEKLPDAEKFPEKITDEPTKIVGKVDSGLAAVQKQLRRIGALDYDQKPIRVDGKPGPRTATALASVTTLPCIGGAHCSGTSRFLKNKNLQQASVNVLKRFKIKQKDPATGKVVEKDRMTPEQSANKIVAKLKRKMKPGQWDMKKGLALVDDAFPKGTDTDRAMASGEGPPKSSLKLPQSEPGEPTPLNIPKTPLKRKGKHDKPVRESVKTRLRDAAKQSLQTGKVYPIR